MTHETWYHQQQARGSEQAAGINNEEKGIVRLPLRDDLHQDVLRAVSTEQNI